MCQLVINAISHLVSEHKTPLQHQGGFLQEKLSCPTTFNEESIGKKMIKNDHILATTGRLRGKNAFSHYTMSSSTQNLENCVFQFFFWFLALFLAQGRPLAISVNQGAFLFSLNEIWQSWHIPPRIIFETIICPGVSNLPQNHCWGGGGNFCASHLRHSLGSRSHSVSGQSGEILKFNSVDGDTTAVTPAYGLALFPCAVHAEFFTPISSLEGPMLLGYNRLEDPHTLHQGRPNRPSEVQGTPPEGPISLFSQLQFKRKLPGNFWTFFSPKVFPNCHLGTVLAGKISSWKGFTKPPPPNLNPTQREVPTPTCSSSCRNGVFESWFPVPVTTHFHPRSGLFDSSRLPPMRLTSGTRRRGSQPTA